MTVVKIGILKGPKPLERSAEAEPLLAYNPNAARTPAP